MIVRNCIVKNAKKFLDTMQRILSENSLAFPKNRQQNEMILLIYDVNDHLYSKLKPL